MSLSVKKLFMGYLSQLNIVVDKVPSKLFSESLSEDMMSLEMNAKIAANFLLRGYCPLLTLDVKAFIRDEAGKMAVIQQLIDTRRYLDELPEVHAFDDSKFLSDEAGFAHVELCQSEFIYQYIIPNFFFHMGMVYAAARSCGVPLSKGDFDGLHHYPPGFSFVSESE